MFSEIKNTVKVISGGKTVATATATILKEEENKMSCKCKCLLRATNITLTNAGVATITVPDGTITDLCYGEKIEIGLFTSIPTSRACNQVRVTDGHTTLDIYCNNQYWRPCMLKCRSVLVLENYEDPDLLVIRAVKGRGAI